MYRHAHRLYLAAVVFNNCMYVMLFATIPIDLLES